MRAGLVSVTFRQFSPVEIIEAARDAGLAAIEWGGDVHVPPGNRDRARQVAAATVAAGLAVSCYGSYYRLGDEPPGTWERVLETAQTLGSPRIRVWAGRVGSDVAGHEQRVQVALDARRIAESAAAAGIAVVTEWHGGTLTDTAASAQALFAAVDHDNLKTYWQPRAKMAFDDCLLDQRAALERVVGVHVFQWHPVDGARRPLAEGADVWPEYLRRAAAAGATDALLEFVAGDDPSKLARDAAALRGWLAALDG